MLALFRIGITLCTKVLVKFVFKSYFANSLLMYPNKYIPKEVILQSARISNLQCSKSRIFWPGIFIILFKGISMFYSYSNIDISRYLPYHHYILDTFPTFYLHFNSCFLKLLISQSKFYGTRKFTLRYQ